MMHHQKLIALAFLVLALCAFPSLTLQAADSAAQQHAQEHAQVRRGTKLWTVYCVRCHQAPPRSAYSPAQWDTIMLHMRSRANLTGEDAKDILKYLQ